MHTGINDRRKEESAQEKGRLSLCLSGQAEKAKREKGERVEGLAKQAFAVVWEDAQIAGLSFRAYEA